MRKLALVLLLVVVGCRRQVEVSSPPSTVVGASAAREAVHTFMAAARAQDVQAMSMIWGTSAGAARNTMDHQEMEKRIIVMMCFLKHDDYQILGEAPAAGGERVIAASVTRRDQKRQTQFYSTRGPAERWYVRAVDLEPLGDFCAQR